MKVLKNMKVRTKLALSFAIIVLFVFAGFMTILFNVYNVKENDTNNRMYIIAPTEIVEQIQDGYDNSQIFKYKAISMALAGRDASGYVNEAREAMKSVDEGITTYFEYNNSIENVNSEIVNEKLSVVYDAVADYEENSLEKILQYAESGQGEYALATDLSSSDYTNAIDAALKDYTLTRNNYSDRLSEKTSDTLAVIYNLIVFLLIFLVVICIIVGVLISREIGMKIKHLISSVNQIARGDFSGNIALPYNDEFGELSKELACTAEIVSDIIEEIHAFSARQDDGRISEFIDKNKYEGEYANMIEVLNNSYSKIYIVFEEFLEAMNELSNGNFEFEYREQPNEKVVLNEVYNKIQENFNNLNNELDTIVTAVSQGNFNVTADADSFSGEWSEILVKLNTLVECVKLPIEDVKYALVELSNGNLSVNVDGEYVGAFDEMKVSLNETIFTLREIISNIANALNQVANKNLDVTVDADFVGDFNEIKQSIDLILSELNKIFAEFKVGADEVAVGGKQIADSSIHLSEQATEQSNSIKELSVLLESIFDKTRENAKSSQDANIIAKTSLSNANEGDEKMKQMLEAMEAISSSSNEIANIIKVIDDIAFQTNLLALNAAVEAARAGVHGKGFAVVADEVRQLASKSSDAAKETSQLITKSISSVNLGSELALSTNEALSTIVKNVGQVSSIINDINMASKNQLDAVEIVSGNLENIEDVVDSVLASSQEGVSTAEELSSQSVILNQYISEFKLSGN